MRRVIGLVLCGMHWLLAVEAQQYLAQKYSASAIEDAKLDMVPLARKYGYPVETHYTTTEDNYVLCLHRLPRPQARPIFLMHGLLDSSTTWILMGPWGGLGYYLYDQGYDVWMGNARGNYYSRNHTTYNPDHNRSFWKFSWHEIGYYDLPAMIDYVLQRTGRAKLGYIGHSQGTTAFFVMASTRPEYNAKISMMSALAPVAFMPHVKAPLLFVLRNLIAVSGDYLYEFLPRSELIALTCLNSKLAEDTCLETSYQIFGPDPKMWNSTLIPVGLSHFPSGCNFKQVRHYTQLIDSGRFCQYDYGPSENLKRYGQRQPKDYPLGKISAPIGLYYAANDYLTRDVDVVALAARLPAVAEKVLYKNWNHMTVVWGVEARQQLHQRMLQTMRKYE